MSARSAPKREVVRVWKSGAYGSVGWHHELACGHIEVRKRRAPAEVMACLQCGGEAPAQPLGVEIDPVVQMQSTEARVKNLLSSKLKVPSESITVLFDIWGEVVGASIHLDAHEVDLILVR